MFLNLLLYNYTAGWLSERIEEDGIIIGCIFTVLRVYVIRLLPNPRFEVMHPEHALIHQNTGRGVVGTSQLCSE